MYFSLKEIQLSELFRLTLYTMLVCITFILLILLFLSAFLYLQSFSSSAILTFVYSLPAFISNCGVSCSTRHTILLKSFVVCFSSSCEFQPQSPVAFLEMITYAYVNSASTKVFYYVMRLTLYCRYTYPCKL